MASAWQRRHLAEKTLELNSSPDSALLNAASILSNDADSRIGLPQRLQETPRNSVWIAVAYMGTPEKSKGGDSELSSNQEP